MEIRTTSRIGKIVLALIGVAMSLSVMAQVIDPDERLEDSPGTVGQVMTAERLGELIMAVDEDAVRQETTWFFHVAELETIIVYDINADRMRILIPIGPTDNLVEEEFLIGLGQTANVVASYGTSYSSGLFIFGSGDSAEIERKRLIDELKDLTKT